MAGPFSGRSVFVSHLRRRLPASGEPGFMDGPKKRFRVFLYGSSIVGRPPGFFFI